MTILKLTLKHKHTYTLYERVGEVELIVIQPDPE